MKVILKGYQKVGKILEVFKKKDSILNASCEWRLVNQDEKEGYFDLIINKESQHVRFDYLTGHNLNCAAKSMFSLQGYCRTAPRLLSS